MLKNMTLGILQKLPMDIVLVILFLVEIHVIKFIQSGIYVGDILLKRLVKSKKL
jgi:hypothetical protein